MGNSRTITSQKVKTSQPLVLLVESAAFSCLCDRPWGRYLKGYIGTSFITPQRSWQLAVNLSHLQGLFLQSKLIVRVQSPFSKW